MRALYFFHGLVGVALGAAAMSAQAAPVTQLMADIPPPPKDIDAALSWMDGGNFVNPGYLAFKQKVEQEKAEIAALNGGAPPQLGSPVSPDVEEPGQVKRAIRAYDAYLNHNSAERSPEALLKKRTRWVQRAMGQQQMTIAQKMQPCVDPCKDPADIPANANLLAQRDRLLSQELEMWALLFEDWRKSRVDFLNEAEPIIEGAGEGALAQTPQGKAGVATYRAAMLKEVELMLSITELSVQRAAAIDRGLDGSEPDSISGATPKQK